MCYNIFGDVMSDKFEIEIIGKAYNDYNEKFGISRQSGLANSVITKIVFEKEYASTDFFKGLEQFSHIWLIWLFSETVGKSVNATVRPPKLGGNERMGVFATRSPFRPNNIGLSSVKIIKTEYDKNLGTVIYVSGADLMNGTPIIDIKPFLPYTDNHPDASNGFAKIGINGLLKINCPDELFEKIPSHAVNGLFEALKQDPRPSYQSDSERIYGMSFGNIEVKFKVENDELTITDIKKQVD